MISTSTNLMRAVLATAGLFVTLVCFGQQKPIGKPSIAGLLTQLHSDELADRVKAFERVRSDPAALRSRQVQEALLDLLDRENQLRESLSRGSHERSAVSDKYGEGFGDYVGEIGETVDSFADWNDPHQVCIFVHESYNHESQFAAKIASHAKVAAPCLIQMYGSSDVGSTRASAASVLVQVLGKHADQIDSATAQIVRQAILAALRDPVEVVRSSAVHALGVFGGEDMIPELQQIAESDPAFSKTYQTFWIRQYALKAIADIRKRTASQSVK
jgi:hypothetical protein